MSLALSALNVSSTAFRNQIAKTSVFSKDYVRVSNDVTLSVTWTVFNQEDALI